MSEMDRLTDEALIEQLLLSGTSSAKEAASRLARRASQAAPAPSDGLREALEEAVVRLTANGLDTTKQRAALSASSAQEKEEK